MSVSFKPAQGRLLVEEAVAKEEKTASGIIVPVSGSDANQGVVVRVGDGVDILEGTHISYREGAGRLMKVDGKQYLLIFISEVDGIFENK